MWQNQAASSQIKVHLFHLFQNCLQSTDQSQPNLVMEHSISGVLNSSGDIPSSVYHQSVLETTPTLAGHCATLGHLHLHTLPRSSNGSSPSSQQNWQSHLLKNDQLLIDIQKNCSSHTSCSNLCENFPSLQGPLGNLSKPFVSISVEQLPTITGHMEKHVSSSVPVSKFIDDRTALVTVSDNGNFVPVMTTKENQHHCSIVTADSSSSLKCRTILSGNFRSSLNPSNRLQTNQFPSAQHSVAASISNIFRPPRKPPRQEDLLEIPQAVASHSSAVVIHNSPCIQAQNLTEPIMLVQEGTPSNAQHEGDVFSADNSENDIQLPQQKPCGGDQGNITHEEQVIIPPPSQFTQAEGQ